MSSEDSAETEIHDDWIARPYQWKVCDYLERGGKRAVVIWPRRAGKDELCLHWTLLAAAKRPAVYWHMLPEAAQARKVIWDAINPHSGKRRIDEAFPTALRLGTHEQEMRIKLRAEGGESVWQLVGSDNFDSLMGAPPAGIVFSEWPLANPEAWSYLRPILAENGGWAIWAYTPRGQNHGKDLYELALSEPGWFAQLLTVDDTKHIPPDVLESERRQMVSERGEDEGRLLFEQEYYCSFSAPRMGSYYGSAIEAMEKAGRVCDVPYDPSYPVHTGWDLGHSNATVVWFAQVRPAGVFVIDHLRGTHGRLDQYVKAMKDRPYVYEQHAFPHDVEVAELVGGNRKQHLESLGLPVHVLSRTSVDDRINAATALLGKTWFDRTLCAEGLRALRNYRREWDDKRHCYRLTPLHDWSADDADSFGYLAQSLPDAPGTWGKKLPQRGLSWVV